MIVVVGVVSFLVLVVGVGCFSVSLVGVAAFVFWNGMVREGVFFYLSVREVLKVSFFEGDVQSVSCLLWFLLSVFILLVV